MMCELKVSIQKGGHVDDVAENIIYVKVTNSGLIVKDILGNSKKLENAVITEININKESLTLSYQPILTKVQHFQNITDSIISDGQYSPELESVWDEIKAEADSTIRDLWKKFGGKKN